MRSSHNLIDTGFDLIKAAAKGKYSNMWPMLLSNNVSRGLFAKVLAMFHTYSGSTRMARGSLGRVHKRCPEDKVRYLWKPLALPGIPSTTAEVGFIGTLFSDTEHISVDSCMFVCHMLMCNCLRRIKSTISLRKQPVHRE
jgi:hypothetical protein